MEAKEKYNKAKFLEERIISLKTKKMYLQSQFSIDGGFRINTFITILGQVKSTPFDIVPVDLFAPSRNNDGINEDNQYILDSIQKRIEQLENEFNELMK